MWDLWFANFRAAPFPATLVFGNHSSPPDQGVEKPKSKLQVGPPRHSGEPG